MSVCSCYLSVDEQRSGAVQPWGVGVGVALAPEVGLGRGLHHTNDLTWDIALHVTRTCHCHTAARLYSVKNSKYNNTST